MVEWQQFDGPEVQFRCVLRELGGFWIEIVYEQSLTTQVVRPVVEYVGDFGRRSLLPAAVLGRGRWVGFVAEGTQEIRILGGAAARSF